MSVIEFDKPLYEDLKTAYEKALVEGVDMFVWQGREMLVSYVKYVLEYLAERFK